MQPADRVKTYPKGRYDLLTYVMDRTHIAYVIDPRFPGGTSSAVAAEIAVVSKFARVSIHGLNTKMFEGAEPSPVLQDALTELGLDIKWDTRVISADVVLFHNPSCLKFQDDIATTIIARHLIVVTHENFVRPSGAEAFDVDHCLSQLLRNSFVLSAALAPLSDWNRKTIQTWQDLHGRLDGWDILEEDWFNICDFPMTRPRTKISDRRGRLSRPGFEKFPPHDVMTTCFPRHAEANIILGADVLMTDEKTPAHWTLFPFRAITVERFFEMIDFMVYFVSPLWRESFGRVIAEGVAAGKIVITDPATAKAFGGAVIAAKPDEVDDIIAHYVENPKKYETDVRAAQAMLAQFSPEAFETQMRPVLSRATGRAV